MQCKRENRVYRSACESDKAPHVHTQTRRLSVEWLCAHLSRRAVGYSNPESRAEFPRVYIAAAPDTAMPMAKPHVEDAASVYDETERQKAIIIDAGNCETKMTLCSFIDS